LIQEMRAKMEKIKGLIKEKWMSRSSFLKMSRLSFVGLSMGFPSKSLKRINFTLFAPKAQNVFLAGDFNGWNTYSHPLKKDFQGTWKTSINLIPGRYEYRFLVDGQWQNDPNCTNFTPNSFGSENCLLSLEEL